MDKHHASASSFAKECRDEVDEDDDDRLLLELYREPPVVEQFIATFLTVARHDLELHSQLLVFPDAYVLQFESSRLLRDKPDAAQGFQNCRIDCLRNETQRAQRMIDRLRQAR